MAPDGGLKDPASIWTTATTSLTAIAIGLITVGAISTKQGRSLWGSEWIDLGIGFLAFGIIAFIGWLVVIMANRRFETLVKSSATPSPGQSVNGLSKTGALCIVLATPMGRWTPSNQMEEACAFADRRFSATWSASEHLPDRPSEWQPAFARLISSVRRRVEDQAGAIESNPRLGLILRTPEPIAWKLGEFFHHRVVDIFQYGLGSSGHFHATTVDPSRFSLPALVESVGESFRMVDWTIEENWAEEQADGAPAFGVVINYGDAKSYMLGASSDARHRGADRLLLLTLNRKYRETIPENFENFSRVSTETALIIRQFLDENVVQDEMQQTAFVYLNTPCSIAFSLGAILGNAGNFSLIQWYYDPAGKNSEFQMSALAR